MNLLSRTVDEVKSISTSTPLCFPRPLLRWATTPCHQDGLNPGAPFDTRPMAPARSTNFQDAAVPACSGGYARQVGRLGDDDFLVQAAATPSISPRSTAPIVRRPRRSPSTSPTQYLAPMQSLPMRPSRQVLPRVPPGLRSGPCRPGRSHHWRCPDSPEGQTLRGRCEEVHIAYSDSPAASRAASCRGERLKSDHPAAVDGPDVREITFHGRIAELRFVVQSTSDEASSCFEGAPSPSSRTRETARYVAKNRNK